MRRRCVVSDDIVTRLRERAIVLFSNGADGNAFIDEHAADEIERLRELAGRLADEGRCRHCTDHPAIWHDNCAFQKYREYEDSLM